MWPCAADLAPRRAKSHLSLSAGMVRQLRESVSSDGKGTEMHRFRGGGDWGKECVRKHLVCVNQDRISC